MIYIELYYNNQLCPLTRGKKINERKEEKEKGNRTFQLKQDGYVCLSKYICI